MHTHAARRYADLVRIDHSGGALVLFTIVVATLSCGKSVIPADAFSDASAVDASTREAALSTPDPAAERSAPRDRPLVLGQRAGRRLPVTRDAG
jgi:hypothetical protein